MPSRAELNLRARVCNIDPDTVANDSVLEQKVLYAEKTIAAGASTVKAVPADNTAGVKNTLAGVAGDANI